MSSISAKFNLSTNNWVVAVANELHPEYVDLYIGFTSEVADTQFNNLVFGYELRRAGEVLYSNNFPPEGVKYVRSDQEYLVCERLGTQENTEYELYMWVTNNEVTHSKVSVFSSPEVVFNDVCWWDGENWQPAIVSEQT